MRSSATPPATATRALVLKCLMQTRPEASTTRPSAPLLSLTIPAAAGDIAFGMTQATKSLRPVNVTCIGATGQDVSNSCCIEQDIRAASASGAGVLINSDGKLGSRRFFPAIQEQDHADGGGQRSAFCAEAGDVSLQKEIDSAGTSQFGLVAEDVENVNPDLVVRDGKGKAYSVRYDQVNAMLLNEFLKEHIKVEKLEATVAALAAQLDKVAAQVQINHPAMRVAVENQQSCGVLKRYLY